jgi:hypothetical protein
MAAVTWSVQWRWESLVLAAGLGDVRRRQGRVQPTCHIQQQSEQDKLPGQNFRFRNCEYPNTWQICTPPVLTWNKTRISSIVHLCAFHFIVRTPVNTLHYIWLNFVNKRVRILSQSSQNPPPPKKCTRHNTYIPYIKDPSIYFDNKVQSSGGSSQSNTRTSHQGERLKDQTTFNISTSQYYKIWLWNLYVLGFYICTFNSITWYDDLVFLCAEPPEDGTLFAKHM